MNKFIGKKSYLLTFFIVIVLCVSVLKIHSNEVDVQAKKKTYTMTAKSKPISKRYLKSKLYTKKTRTYFALRDRLERLEKSKGGTIILKKGTYSLTNAVYVPSNVTIIFKNGVKFTKGKSTRVKGWKASSSMFQLIKPSKSKKKRVYGKYNGMKNITFRGEGNAVIDMKYFNKGISIITGHNKNVTITGLTFKNIKSGHFIEMDATKNAKITDCKFYNGKGNAKKEAINLDTPDKTTRGYSQEWSKFDKTPNYKVNIENCEFSNLGRSIGTHQYSGGKYHTYVTIKNCSIKKMKEDAVRMMNWKYPVFMNNSIDHVVYSGRNGIIGSGLIYPTIKNNTFKNIKGKAMLLAPWKNSGGGSQYAITYNKFSNKNLIDLGDNVGVNVKENYVKIAWKYQVYATKKCKVIYLKEN